MSRITDLAAMLRDAAQAHGLEGFTATTRRGRVEARLLWLRPEPVKLIADPLKGRLVLTDVLPFVQPGGRLHRAVKAWLPEPVLCISRGGSLSLGLPVVAPDGGVADWGAALARLLVVGQGVQAMLHAEWPDYARGVFAAPLR